MYAVANLRGGGEYGEDWHQAGMLAKKQNVFDDFIAAAEYLIAERLHLAATTWRSRAARNGGLLVGAALTQRPDLFRAVVCQVPLLDMLRYHRFLIARLWIPGVRLARRRRGLPLALRLLAVPPRQATASPTRRCSSTAAESDTRVDPLHARKMAARLQAAQPSRPAPILLQCESRAGHGAGKPVDKVIAEAVDIWSFLLAQLAMEESKP